ncbi:MAG: SGNH/GDSL hydrolase family protein, partial [Desulfobacteraceae bacterium]|nr:SGNH/GDSL hydrolase family protein [Desulfobacteraceae bacterium]
MKKIKLRFFLLPFLLLLLAAGGNAWASSTTSISIPADVYQAQSFDIVGTSTYDGTEPLMARMKIIVSGSMDFDDYEDTSGDGTVASNVFKITAIDGNGSASATEIDTSASLVDGDFITYFGPDSGFPITAGYSDTHTFTIQMNNTFPAPICTYDVTLQLVEWVDSDVVQVLSEATAYANLHLLENAFANIVAFGDSLTDHGNANALDSGLPESWTNREDSPIPGNHVWLDYLNNVLWTSTGSTMYNYAVGGAMTQYNTNESIYTYGLDTQVTDYLAGNDPYNGTQDLPIDPLDPADTLYVIWIGANDMMAYLSSPDGDPTDEITAAVTRIGTQMGLLAADGATNFLVLNLPDLGATPYLISSGTTAQAGATALTQAFNSALTSALVGFESGSGLTVNTADAFFIMHNLTAIDMFDNETDMYVSASGTPDPKDYLFYDGIHPTTHAHLVMANILTNFGVGAYIDKNENGSWDIIDDPTYPTIQEAVDTAVDGEIVIVPSDTAVAGAGIISYKLHTEAIAIETPNLTLKSANGRDSVLINNPNVGSETFGIGVLANMGTVTVDGFTVNNFRNGICQSSTQSVGTAYIVKNCKVIPENMGSAPYLRNGIQVSGANSQVIGNYIVGAPLTNDWASTGIGVVNASNVLVQGNTVNTNNNAGYGINVLNYSTALVEQITIKENSVTGSSGIGIAGYDNTKEVTDVFIYDNIIHDNRYAGINVQTVSLGNATITGNQILDNNQGIRVSGTSAVLTGDVSANNNTITGNDFGVVGIDGGPYVDATNNWWGAANGPGGSGPGDGDSVWYNVYYDPWLTSDPSTAGTDTIGVYDPATRKFYLRNSNDNGVADVVFGYGG